jgi:hypothetical protein
MYTMLPSGWNAPMAQLFPGDPPVREVLLATAADWRTRDLHLDLRVCLNSFAHSPTVAKRVVKEADNFGSVSWHRFDFYARALASKPISAFRALAIAEFREYAVDIGMTNEVARLTERDWDWYTRTIYVYLLFGVLDNPRIQGAFRINRWSLRLRRLWRHALGFTRIRPW